MSNIVFEANSTDPRTPVFEMAEGAVGRVLTAGADADIGDLIARTDELTFVNLSKNMLVLGHDHFDLEDPHVKVELLTPGALLKLT